MGACQSVFCPNKGEATITTNGSTNGVSKKPAESTSSNVPVDAQPSEYVEDVVCNETDVNENEMKQFKLGEHGKVLVAKQDGQWHAVGTKCTHYGAPMVNGALGKGRIRCPWHGACFSLANGDIEDFPGMDSLPCYQVKVEDGKVKVRAKKTDLKANIRVKEMTKRDPSNKTTFVVVGAGPSGAICAETLRQEGFSGRLVLVNKENVLPYDRVKVTKAMNLGPDHLKFRSQAFYDDNAIEILSGIEATALDTVCKEITLSNTEKVKYDKIFIATGLAARKAPVPGADLKNVEVARTVEHSQYILSQLTPETRLVVLGISFIGLEAAAWCVDKVKSVIVIGRDRHPLIPIFGEKIGIRVQRLCESKGIQFRLKSGIKQCNGDESGKIISVETVDGEVLPADLCIMGVGSTCYTDFLKGSGVEVNSDGTIEVNEYCQSNVPDVYVGGDIAKAPVYSSGMEKHAIGHYGLAQYHGRTAALNMIRGNTKALKAVPFFWSMLFGVGIKYSGHGRPHDVYITGDLEKFEFTGFCLDENEKVIGIASAGQTYGAVAAQFAEFLTQGNTLYKKDLHPDPLSFVKQLNQ